MSALFHLGLQIKQYTVTRLYFLQLFLLICELRLFSVISHPSHPSHSDLYRSFDMCQQRFRDKLRGVYSLTTSGYQLLSL